MQSDVPELVRKLPIPVGIRLITAPFCHIIVCSWEIAVPRNAIMLFIIISMYTQFQINIQIVSVENKPYVYAKTKKTVVILTIFSSLAAP